MKEFITAFEEVDKQDNPEFELNPDGSQKLDDEGNPIPVEDFIPFKVDGRELRAYPPTDGQLAFMLAALGRGQSADQRFASIINIMLSSMRGEDQDYLEGRLLTRDPKQKLPVSQIEAIFEFLTEEWFARPTQPQSGSAPSPQSDGQN